ncbi:MAG: Rha family transcriptional regulator [Bacilli bacterium]
METNKTLVFVENDRPVTDSLTVADVFGKEHKHVMRDIQGILAEIDPKWGVPNFGLTPYVHPQNGQTYKKYILTEDGFTLLVMGYTGKDAMRFKVDYIQEFRRMQEQLRQAHMAVTYKLPQTFKEALLALVAQVEKTEQLETKQLMLQQCLAETQPKITYLDRILESKDTVLITQIAKDYGLSGRRLNAILHDEGVQYKVKDQWVLYWTRQDMGYTKSHTVEFTRSHGEQGTKLQTEWTQKGRLFIHEILAKRGIVPFMDRALRKGETPPVQPSAEIIPFKLQV